MNMAAHLEEEAYVPATVEARLREFYKARFRPDPNCWPPESPMYAVLHSPGRATNTSQDGGMASRMTRMGFSVARWNRVQEVGAALRAMPTVYRTSLDAKYDVPDLEHPRTVRAAAEKLRISTGAYGKNIEGAMAWLSGRLCLVHHI